MTELNPVGLAGIEFVEYAGTNPKDFETLFEKFGFRKFADHKKQKVQLFRQGDINFLINSEPGSFAEEFQKQHGPSICAMGFRVQDSKKAFEVAVQRGARAYTGNSKKVCDFPAIYGIGDSLIYFVDKYGAKDNMYESNYDFNTAERTHVGMGFTLVDHLTNNVPRGKMQEWCDFYEKIFGFKERRYFDIKGKKTGLISKVMASPDGKICIPINEPTDTKSQIQEYLDEYKGPGIQHLALLTNDICPSVSLVRDKGIGFLDAPETYFRMIPERVPNVTEKISRLQDLKILVDGDAKGYLLQIFTQNLIGPIFFEVIQRKGHDGFGDGNFQALFDAIERDQMKRGVI
jgi:4-hydroxyphenylpyruvate dioxygenase